MFASKLFLFAPVLGVVVGALLSFLIQLPLIKLTKFEYIPTVKITRGLIEFTRLIVPRVVTTLAAQIDATVDLSLTTILGTGSYTVFYLAQSLQLLPVSIIGISVGQASLPYLSQTYQEGKLSEFKKIIIDSLLSILFFTIPTMSFFIFARTPLVRLFFGGEKFDWPATVATAITLSYFALSIPFHSIYYFITRCFYAFLDSRTPFLVSSATVLLNILLSLSFIFVWHLPVWGLAMAFSISIIINVIVLLSLLTRKVKGLNFRFFTIELTKILTATFVSSFIIYYVLKLLDGLVFDTSRTINVFFLLVTGSIGYFGLYIFLCWLFKIEELALITNLVQKAQKYQRRIIEIYTEIEK